jgi:hypothetical protein
MIMEVFNYLPYGMKCKYVYVLCTVAALIIFLNYALFKIHNQDYMNEIVFRDLPILGDLSWWPISHFVLYLILGYLFPQCWILILSIGVLWEGFEKFYGDYVDSQKAEDGGEYSTWWAWNWKDVVMNIMGFLTGTALRKTIG